MKNIVNIITAALVMLAAVGCEKEENITQNQVKEKITLSVAINTEGTKTSLGDNENSESYPILWSKGDAIAVINDGRLFKFVVNDEDAGKNTATFTLQTFDNCGYIEETFDKTKPIQAFYPFDGLKLYNSQISYTVPAVQTYQENVADGETISTFGQGIMPMAAYADDANSLLFFYNLFGILKLQLVGESEEKLQSIEVFSDKATNGETTINITESLKTIALANEPNVEQKRLVLKKGSSDIVLSTSESAPTEILIAIPAEEHNFSVYIITDKGAYHMAVSSAKRINPGNMLKMDILNLPEFENKMAYVENGVCLGKGITVDGKVWAPVNCGYEPANGEYKGYTYGKLYQWGRKYGQGYNGEYYNQEELTDATIPDYILGPVDFNEVQKPENANCYYADWQNNVTENLWNSGTEEYPVKTQYDPCPEGWRVPTLTEFDKLAFSNIRGTDMYDFIENNNGIGGVYLWGDRDEEEGMKNAVFLPLAGWRVGGKDFDLCESKYSGGNYTGIANYWTSTKIESKAKTMKFDDWDIIWDGYKNTEIVSSGLSVRCIKE